MCFHTPLGFRFTLTPLSPHHSPNENPPCWRSCWSRSYGIPFCTPDSDSLAGRRDTSRSRFPVPYRPHARRCTEMSLPVTPFPQPQGIFVQPEINGIQRLLIVEKLLAAMPAAIAVDLQKWVLLHAGDLLGIVALTKSAKHHLSRLLSFAEYPASAGECP